MKGSEDLGVFVKKDLPQGLISRVTMDLAAGLAFLGCISSVVVDMMEECLEVRSEALIS